MVALLRDGERSARKRQEGEKYKISTCGANHLRIPTTRGVRCDRQSVKTRRTSKCFGSSVRWPLSVICVTPRLTQGPARLRGVVHDTEHVAFYTGRAVPSVRAAVARPS